MFSPAIYLGAGAVLIILLVGRRLMKASGKIEAPKIEAGNDGFLLRRPSDDRIIAEVRWSEVLKIVAYKLDLVTTDCIFLLFELSGEQEPVQVSEEWEGFTNLFHPLLRAFPSVPENWYVEVMAPAFQKKYTVLYEANSEE